MLVVVFSAEIERQIHPIFDRFRNLTITTSPVPAVQNPPVKQCVLPYPGKSDENNLTAKRMKQAQVLNSTKPRNPIVRTILACGEIS